MSDYPATPVLSEHARERCAEMGINTKVAKRIVQHADVIRDAVSGQPDSSLRRKIVCSSRYPDFAVVYVPAKNLIVTVVFRAVERYERVT